MESMVALSILTVGFLGMLTLLAKSLSLNREIANSYVGNYLALEGMELVKNVIDANIAYMQNLNNQQCKWNSGFETAGVYELDWRLTPVDRNDSKKDCPGKAFAQWTYIGDPLKMEQFVNPNGEVSYMYGYRSGTPTSFTRRIEVTPNPQNSDELRVNSIVEWAVRGGGTFAVNVEHRLYNWQRR